MGAMKDLQFALDENPSLEHFADLLGGVVVAGFIRCPSPKRASNDRSCIICLNPKYPGDFFIYDCIGSREIAAAMVREKLGILQFVSRDDNTGGAVKEWDKSVAAQGTIVERYLRSRRIILPVPPALRFQSCRWHSRDYAGPAMIAAVSDVKGNVIAIHQTWLAPNGAGKAAIDKPRKCLGPIKGGAIQLGHATRTLAIAEGIETALSFMQESGVTAWSALFAGGLRTVNLPSEVTEVWIAADGDPTGGDAAYAAATRFRGEGRTVKTFRAPPGKDFNTLLMEKGR